jgi:prefoldin subunit 5
MNSYKQKIEYLAQSYIAIAQRTRKWDRVKELIESHKNTEEAVKQRIKEILGKK